MTHSGHFPRALVLWTLFFSLCAAGAGVVGAAQPASSDPMKIVPADALFCVRINKLTTTLGQVDQFLTGISPVGVSMPVGSQLGLLLGKPDPNGINMAGDLVVFGPLPGGEAPNPKRVGVLFPLSNFQQFLRNPNVTKPDAQGILKIGPEGKQNVAGVQMGSYLLLTDPANQQALTEAKNWTSGAGAASLAQRLGPEELKRAAGSPVWAYGNVQIANKLFGPMIQEKIKEAQKSMEQAQTKGAAMPFQMGPIMDMYTSMINSFLQETQSVSLTLDPSATAIRLALGVAAMPDSEMGKILSTKGDQQQQPNLLAYTENGAISTGITAFSPAFAKAVTLKRIDLATMMMGQFMSKEDLANLKKFAIDATDAFGGSAAWAFSANLQSKPPFSLKYVRSLKDKQKFNDLLDQALKIMNETAMASFSKTFGLKIQCNLKRNAETYKEVPIDAISVTFQAVDANSPMAQMIKAMYGEGLNLRLAVANNLLLYTLSADPEKSIHALIDQAKAGGPGQVPSEVQTALQLIPEAKTANYFGTYNIARLMQMTMAFMPMAGAPPADVSTQSAVAFAGNVGNGRVLTNIAIPKQQVLDLMGIFMKMQQQKMQQQQQVPVQPRQEPQPTKPAKPPQKQRPPSSQRG
jgi:hypothetical protein